VTEKVDSDYFNKYSDGFVWWDDENDVSLPTTYNEE
jgi:hypothetical protein